MQQDDAICFTDYIFQCWEQSQKRNFQAFKGKKLLNSTFTSIFNYTCAHTMELVGEAGLERVSKTDQTVEKQ